ncbi:polysaccharide pyruvyl transferase family protein [Massilia timonae]|uniref:Polysaccharide pyruvyl transferase domain-containing protein n=1 Tax=Massilia timonae CCUG 45783 TaxID=883126 RepID=K9DHV0_9BURK|nr:polysaccharide pyruvyl transferase family protein [Massilia timonae]EKU82866.1 hypothetical protein HMPREF9710_01877 [Massilia timonae CCUG 45783]
MPIKLAYAASTARVPYANFGDALNPIILHLLTGEQISHSNFDSDEHKLVAIGTILQDFRNGTADVWGTGLDVRVSAMPNERHYFDPLLTNVFYRIHAVRGQITAHTLRAFGIDVPATYGDPAILLRRMLNTYIKGEKQGKIGLVCHLSELTRYDNTASTRDDLHHYKLGSEDLSIISPITLPTAKDVLAKVKEIASYKYILSRSLHGLIIADIFDIPCAYLTSGTFRSGVYNIFDATVDIDHRIRDYYSGLGRTTAPVYVCPPDGVNVEEAQRFLERSWEPYSKWNSISNNLLNALPFSINGYQDYTTIPSTIDNLKV